MLFNLLPPRAALRKALLSVLIVPVLIVLTLLLLGAAPGPPGIIVFFGEPATVQAGEMSSALAVLGADARVDGTVRNTLFVAGGQAEVLGAVHGNVVVVGGKLILGPHALVTGDVMLFGSTVSGAGEATIVGALTHDSAYELGREAALFWWMSSTLALVGLALGVVALFGARPRVIEAGLVRTGRAALVGFVAVLAAPLAAGVAFMTGIGLGLGLVILAALPGLILGGYVTAGLALGADLLHRWPPRWADRPWAPYAAGALGVVALQVFWVIPFLGLVSALAAVVGVGALALGARRPEGARWDARPALSLSPSSPSP